MTSEPGVAWPTLSNTNVRRPRATVSPERRASGVPLLNRFHRSIDRIGSHRRLHDPELCVAEGIAEDGNRTDIAPAYVVTPSLLGGIVGLGVVVVALAPPLTSGKPWRLDITSTLRVME